MTNRCRVVASIVLLIMGSGCSSGGPANGVPSGATITGPALPTVSASPSASPSAAASRSAPTPTPTATSTPVAGLLPPVSPAYYAAARFLDQATWGARQADAASLESVGIAKWLTTQFALPPSALQPVPAGYIGAQWTPDNLVYNALTGPDQLRQRIAFALSTILTVSCLQPLPNCSEMPNYWGVLERDAFANYLTILHDITLNPQMGEFLDLLNNSESTSGASPNENYARELLQLMTIGTVLLNQDGSPVLDSNGRPVAAYTDSDVRALARVFTGWTYAAADPLSSPLVANEQAHDTGAKTVLGSPLAPGQTAEQDLDQALQVIFDNQNVGPFLALRLIQHFVKSDPTPSYIDRVASVFANDGTGTRGNMKAVVAAVLTDPEARAGDDPALASANDGHLREPMLYMTAVLRALGAVMDPDFTQVQPAGGIQTMGERVDLPPSVFSFYSPFYSLSDGKIPAPEFQLLTSSNAVAQASVIWSLLLNNGVNPPFTIPMGPFVSAATNPVNLLATVDLLFTRGAMPVEMQRSILGAIDATSDPVQRAQTALFLVATSGLFRVIR